MAKDFLIGKKIIGLTEKIKVRGMNGSTKSIVARIDTGATKSSIDHKLAAKLELGPIVKTKLVKSAHGNSIRPIIKIRVNLAGKEKRGEFTLADRRHMKYKVLIGQNLLKEGYMIDPSRK